MSGFTQVTLGPILDPAGNIYANARVVASLDQSALPAGSGPPLLGGQSVFPTFEIGVTDSFGQLVMNLADVHQITPNGCVWDFTVVAFPGAPGFTLQNQVITGATQNIAAAMQAAAAPLFPSVSFTNVGTINLVEQASQPPGATGFDNVWASGVKPFAHRLMTNLNNTGPTPIAVFSDGLGVFAPTASAQLAGVISDETGTGPLVFATGPTLSPAETSGVVVYADQFANVQAAINALPAAGGTVDARSPSTNLALGALDTGSNTKIVTLLLGPYTYTFTQIIVRQGFNIIGAGNLDTLLNNNGSNANPAFVIPQVNNNIITVKWSDFTVNGLSGNTSQDGMFFDASTLTNAGVQYSIFTNIILLGFNGSGIHLKATQNGVSGSTGAIQGNTFVNVQSTRPTGATGATQNALRIEGGVGQCDFWNCWFLGTTSDTGTNVFCGTTGVQGPYSIHWHSCTNQNGFAYIFDGCTSCTTENDHFEVIKGCYNIATTSQLVAGLNFKTPHINSNVAVNAGNGYVINIPNTVTNADVTLDTPFMGNSNPDHLVINAAAGATVKTINCRTFNSVSPTNVFVSSGGTLQAAPAATLDIHGFNSVQLSASGTSITTLKSTLMPGEQVTFYATGGTAQFATGGNLTLGSQVSPFVLQAGDSATFLRVDAGTPAFILIAYTQNGKISVDLAAQAANIGVTTLYAVPAGAGGWYFVQAYLSTTQAATTSSTQPNIVTAWTDADNSAAQSVTNNPQNPTGNALTGSVAITTFTFRAKASTNITYQTTGYASVGATPMQYGLHIKLEYLGP